ncbi:DUF1707 domain-containing protein [Nocardia sp. NPDC049707]|uniref:DUF1707 SHOCT-like domain-containing protein n=1 Tax=Nocardia sp. NPDC049707 TaxID=3154735 RepID=UPI003425811B
MRPTPKGSSAPLNIVTVPPRPIADLDRLTGDLQVPSAVRDLVPGAPTAPRNPLRRAGFTSRYPDHTRTRDADRDTTGQLLDSARREGQLSEEEHQTLAELAQGATTLGDLADLVDDVQRPTDAPLPPTPPRSNRRRWYVISATAASFGAAVAAFVLTSGVATPDAPPAAPVGAAAPDLGAVQPVVVATPNLLTREGLTHFLAEYREKFGDLQADELTLFSDYATVARGARSAESAGPLRLSRRIRAKWRRCQPHFRSREHRCACDCRATGRCAAADQDTRRRHHARLDRIPGRWPQRFGPRGRDLRE